MKTTNVIRAALLVAAAALVVAAPVLGSPAPAQAHNYLVSSTPSSGEILTELPESFQVTTNEPLLVVGGSTAGFAFQVKDAAGRYYGDGCVEVNGATMTMNAAIGAAGDYTALWQLVSADGHSVSGEIPFTWAPSGDDEPGAGSATPPVCGEAATPAPSASASPAPATSEPTAPPVTASGIDLTTVLWIGGALLAMGIAVAIAIAVAGRRKV